MTLSVFVSYSHDSENHKAWVLQLTTRLRHKGVNTILDRWNLNLGQDVAVFIERGLSKSNRVLCICSEKYVRKAKLKTGGLGYEKWIVMAEIMTDLDTDWVVPVIRNNTGNDLVPTFLGCCFYVDFRSDRRYEEKYEELLRSLLRIPVLPVPKIRDNSFEIIRNSSNQKFIPAQKSMSLHRLRGESCLIIRITTAAIALAAVSICLKLI